MTAKPRLFTPEGAGETPPIDLHLGRRLKLRRMAEGLTQEQLAAEVGIAFQQIQKYECGINRMSSTRLWQFSRILRCPVSYFYVGLGAGSEAAPAQDMYAAVDSLRLVRAYGQIKDPAVRARLLELARYLGRIPAE